LSVEGLFYMSSLVHRLIQHLRSALASLQLASLHLPQPSRCSVLLGSALYFTRGNSQLAAENALLRQQLIILQRHSKKPWFTQTDHLWLVLLASRVRRWKEALLILKPDTLLRWHRQGFRLFWRFKSRNRGGRPRVARETIALIQQMARENSLWGVEPRRRVLPDEPSGIPGERIRGELMKLGIRAAKATIQKYVHQARPHPALGENWSTFLRNHAQLVWACDFLLMIDLFFRQVCAFFIIELGSRRVVHFAVSSHPTDGWAAQQLREAAPCGLVQRSLIRDRDRKHGVEFGRVAKRSSLKSGMAASDGSAAFRALISPALARGNHLPLFLPTVRPGDAAPNHDFHPEQP
jgi:putative transposase